MPSPFPGMDPYLEDASLWPSFQNQLAVTLARELLPTREGLQYAVQTGERRYVEGPEEQCEKHVWIRAIDGGRVVTLVDLVSPANKLTDAGRAAYLATRRQAREAGASAVEIDLVLRGQPTLEYSRDGLPDWDYAVTVTRATHPERFEIYTSTLAKRLMRFKVPLAGDDRDAVVDLPNILNRVYDACGFASKIDYSQDPGVPLSDELRVRVAEALKTRALTPSPQAPA